MATTPEDTGARQSVSGQQVGLVILGLLVVLALLWFLFLRGGGEDETTSTAVPTTAPTTAAPEQEESDTEAGKGPVETFEVFAPKDPFEPLVKEEAAAGAGTGVTIGGVGTTDGTGAGGSPAPSGGGGDTVGNHRVRLIDVFTENGEQRAQVQVDGTVYTVDEGETFAENFRVLSISGDCATMLFGDDQFTLCEGEEILK